LVGVENFYVRYITETGKIYKQYAHRRGAVRIEPTSPSSPTYPLLFGNHKSLL